MALYDDCNVLYDYRNVLYDDCNEHYDDRNVHYDDRNVRYDDRNGQYVARNVHYDDRNEHYNDRNGHYDDRNEHYVARKVRYNDRNGHYDDRKVGNFYLFFDGLLEMGFIFVGEKLCNRMKLKSAFTIISVILAAILFYTIINFNNYSAKNYFKVVEEKFDNGKVQTRKKIPIDNAMMSDFIRYDMEGHIDKITVYLDSTNLNANNHYFTLSFQNEKNSITCIEHFINEESVNFLILDTILYRQKINRCIENAEDGIKYTIENIKLNKKHMNDTKVFEEELQMREEDKISLLNESKVIKVREQWVRPSFDKLFSLEKKLGYHITYLKSNNKVEVINLVYGQDGEILEIRLYNYRNYQNGDYYQLNFEKKEVKKIQQFINYKLVDTAFPI